MRRIVVRDPLALLAIQSGKVGTPIREEGASASNRLCVSQRAVVIGEPVPIVFGLRRDGYGGVFISPGATEARFENNLDNEVKAYYHLVLSEGLISSIQIRDVFQCACRVGSFTQTYNRRAGSWLPGNFIVDRAGKERPEAPYFCGSVGTYPDITTLSFENTSREDSTDWSQQVHMFVRGGIWLPRVLDGGTGPSDNFCDLVPAGLEA
jgi:hypothetical protein